MIEVTDALARALGPQSTQNRDQRVHGVVTARVEKIEDDGTYRLKFFGMNGQDDDDQSAPARVMMPMAGAGRGVHFFPEPGDEVVVGFHAGDTNNPIILGAVWNRDARPPGQARQSARNDVRTIVTRSGHELTFDDAAGAQRITLRSQGGHSIVLDDAPASPTIAVSTADGRRILLDDSEPGSITLRTLSCEVRLAEPGEVTIRATSRISLRAPQVEVFGASVTVGGSTIVDGSPFRGHVHLGGTTAVGTTGPVVV